MSRERQPRGDLQYVGLRFLHGCTARSRNAPRSAPGRGASYRGALLGRVVPRAPVEAAGRRGACSLHLACAPNRELHRTVVSQGRQGSMDQWICRIEGQSANLIRSQSDRRRQTRGRAAARASPTVGGDRNVALGLRKHGATGSSSRPPPPAAAAVAAAAVASPSPLPPRPAVAVPAAACAAEALAAAAGAGANRGGGHGGRGARLADGL